MGWFRDLMLESVAPPGAYLPAHGVKLQIARRALRGNARIESLVKGARLRDFTSAHGYGVPRTVSRGMVAAEIEADYRSVNPPVVQGWMAALLVLAAVWLLVIGFWLDGSGLAELLAIALVIGPPVGTLVLILVAAAEMRTVELRDRRVVVARWLDGWMRRPAVDLGVASEVVAQIDSDVLTLTCGADSIAISMLDWPPSARRGAGDELPIWGVGGLVAERPSRRAERDQRRADALERARERQERRRH